MSVRWCSVVVLVLIGFQIPAKGQNPPTQNTNDRTGVTRSAPSGAVSGIMGTDAQSEGESREDLPAIPSMLGGPGSSLALLSEMERSNYLRAGVNVGAAYDDNALLAPSDKLGNMTYSVFPSIALDQSTSRMRWTLRYGSGLTVNQRLSKQNHGSHDLHFDSEFRLSPHVNFRAAEDFSLIAGMFGTSADPGSQSGGMNGTLIAPLANRRSSQTVVETNYHFARKDVIGASGSFYDLHYSDVSTGSERLADTQVAAGSGFWFHQMFRGDWAGVGYRFQRMTYGPIGETRVHSFTLVNTLTLSKGLTLYAYIGPEYSDNYGIAATGPDAGQVASFSDWSTAGGVELGWQNQRTSLNAGYSKQVSNGSGILGAVRLENIHAGFRRELLAGWAAGVTATYGDNEALTLASATGATSIKSTLVGFSVERNIGRSFGLQFGYFHDIQTRYESSTPSTNHDANRNRYSVTLSYQWAKPLGR